MIENLPTEVSNLLKYSTNIKFFKSIDEVDTYITERISQAKDSVYDLNWQYYPKKNPNPRNQAKKDMLAIKQIRKLRSFAVAKKAYGNTKKSSLLAMKKSGKNA